MRMFTFMWKKGLSFSSKVLHLDHNNRILNLGKYNLKWTTTQDLLHSAIIHLTKTKLKSRIPVYNLN